MRFQDIPQFTRSAPYSFHLPWDRIEDWLFNHQKDEELGMILELDPDFQRPHVWTTDKQMAYIEWILRGGASGKDVYFNHPGWFRDWKGSMDIVDGKQRWQAVKLFLADELPAFNHLYNEFTDRLPLEASFRVHVNDLRTRREVLQWYLDLNSGGVVHTSEELEKVKKLLEQEAA